MSVQRVLGVVLLIVLLLVLINLFRHVRLDPVERDRLNPEQRPRVDVRGATVAATDHAGYPQDIHRADAQLAHVSG